MCNVVVTAVGGSEKTIRSADLVDPCSGVGSYGTVCARAAAAIVRSITTKTLLLSLNYIIRIATVRRTVVAAEWLSRVQREKRYGTPTRESSTVADTRRTNARADNSQLLKNIEKPTAV